MVRMILIFVSTHTGDEARQPGWLVAFGAIASAHPSEHV
jgi:hypothetical protein